MRVWQSYSLESMHITHRFVVIMQRGCFLSCPSGLVYTAAVYTSLLVAINVDYGLFILSRWREELHADQSPEADSRAGANTQPTSMCIPHCSRVNCW